ncbi:hypothetical protein [Kocuria rhizophila]|uniref:Uncharacterized protein n=1 Tax=Kocuria rhizophila (strain ATCC 9341 / DSM 348 / NBRC 103217 / DC2201) TaxID=378753 RepID=B2GFU7_KOCRD|nr:hypothetical protein [Kocuria rhizophila]ASE11321.1 hypothetical protein CEP81_06450 [Kocuria rhizophila]BAG28671.1 hypothetical protein KRH_03240 [Kocuria rhizophila DC2201]VEH76032.1 Uncharacterised protein [Kocuria rhizophila]
MRPFHRTLRSLWLTAGVLVALAAVLWGAALLGLPLVPDDGLGTAVIGFVLLLLSVMSAGISLAFVIARARREARRRRVTPPVRGTR